MSKKNKESKSKGTGCTEPTPARHLNYEGVWEIIKRIVKGETTLSEIGQVVKDLVVNVASHGKRIEVNKRAIRVLDIELLERDHLLWEKMNEVEEAALGGSLDDYEKKEDAESSHKELQESIDKKQDELTAGENIEITEENVVNCTYAVESISLEEIVALFE